MRKVRPKNLAQAVAEHAVDPIELVLPAPDGLSEHEFYAGINLVEPRRWMVISYRENPQTSMSVDWVGFVAVLASVCQLKYGYALRRDVTKSAMLFCLGSINGLDAFGTDQAEAITLWRAERFIDAPAGPYGRCSNGMLRDVYPINVLNATHMDAAICGIRLQDWIEGSNERGALQKIDATTWCWTVDEHEIPSVQRALRDSGLLIAPIEPRRLDS